MRIHSLGNLTLNAIEGTTTDEEDISRIHRDILLIRMLTSTLRRHVYIGTLQQLEQSLLHTLTTHVTGDGGIVALASYLVDFIYKDDTTLGCSHIIVGHLQQTREDTLHVLAHIASLSKYSGIDNGKRHIEQLGDSTCQQSLSCTRRAHHDDITLLNLHTVLVSGLLQTFIVIVNSHRKETLGLVLTNNILVQIVLDLHGFGHRHRLFTRTAVAASLRSIREILLHNTIGLLRTVLADIAIHTRDEQSALHFRPSAEATCLLYHYFFLVRTLSIIP